MIHSRFTPYFLFVFFFSSSIISMDVAVEIEGKKPNQVIIEIMGKNPPERIALLKDFLGKNKNIDFEAANPINNLTPLRAAVLSNQLDTAEILLQAGAKPESHAFTLAASEGRTDFIEPFLNKGADINGRGPFGGTPACIAVASRKALFLKKLIIKGARVDLLFPDGLALLSYAAAEGDCTIGTMLLDAGADPEFRDIKGNSALEYAAGHGKIGFVELLLNRRVDIRATNEKGSTIAHGAAGFGKMKMLQFIQQRFPESIAAQDYLGRTPLYWACRHGRLDIVAYLLEQGVPYDTTLVDGKKMLAFLKERPESKKAYELIIKRMSQNSKIKKSAPQKKKKKHKDKGDKRTYSQRMYAKEAQEQAEAQNSNNNNKKNEICENAVQVKSASPQQAAAELNSLIGICDDNSRVLAINETVIVFGYKHLGDLQTDMIYRLRRNCAESGPRHIYDNRVLDKRKLFLNGARDVDTVLHTQPEALERMSGHALVTQYKDRKERTITNWVLFGKKRIGEDIVEGAYILGFTRIRGEITCYHSFFKPQPFAQALQEIALTVTAFDRELFERLLAQVCPDGE